VSRLPAIDYDTSATSTEYVRDWRHDSACADEDPELHHPIGISEIAKDQAERAKEVCRRCLALERCLAWALESGATDGIAGGLDKDERRKLKARLGRAAKAAPVCGTAEARRLHTSRHEACPTCTKSQYGRTTA
jgi:WhiB family transcriptional regulator, redox-sensing transcriptional regulator